VGYIGASNCTEDELFKQLRDELFNLLETCCKDEELEKLKFDLIERYTQPDKSLKLKQVEEVESLDDYELHEKYKTFLEKCSMHLERYHVPSI